MSCQDEIDYGIITYYEKMAVGLKVLDLKTTSVNLVSVDVGPL